jgi:hypothetical protein
MSDSGNLPQLGQLYPQSRTWLFYRGPFCVSGTVTWSYADESKDLVLGDGFAGSFNCRAISFDGTHAEFEIAGGRLSLYLSFDPVKP